MKLLIYYCYTDTDLTGHWPQATGQRDSIHLELREHSPSLAQVAQYLGMGTLSNHGRRHPTRLHSGVPQSLYRCFRKATTQIVSMSKRTSGLHSLVIVGACGRGARARLIRLYQGAASLGVAATLVQGVQLPGHCFNTGC